jgi:hypothetical protein
LVQNEFIDQQHYRRIFQDSLILDEVVHFASKFYPGNVIDALLIETHDLDGLTETFKLDKRYFSGNLVILYPILNHLESRIYIQK